MIARITIGLIIVAAAQFGVLTFARAEKPWPKSEWSQPAQGRANAHWRKWRPRQHIKRPRKGERKYSSSKRKRRHRHGTHPATEVRAWKRLNGFAADSQKCIGQFATVGDQANSTAGAKAQANKAWSQLVRAMQGERYMDLRNARDRTYSCWHSSVPNIVNRTTQAIGIDTQFERCRIIATPCTPPETK